MLKRFNILIPTELEEPLNGLAERFGVGVFSNPQIRDVPGMGETDYEFTGETIVSFIVSTVEQDAEGIEAEIIAWMKDFSVDSSALSLEEYSENQDWMEGFKAHFKPILLKDKIVIRPPWAEPLEQEKSATTILIDPGMAFGTGTHETTRLCLEFLEGIDVNGETFVDLGAGSGILSFYLMKRGAKSGVAIEIEGPAVENMKKNAKLNNISDQLKMICSDLGSFEPESKFDGLAANITSPVLLEFMSVFSPWVKSGGWGVFSGVNSSNAPAVKKCMAENGWKDLSEITEGDWHGFKVTMS